MKKNHLILNSIGLFLLLENISFAQVSTPFNTGIPTNYVGWNAAQLFPLQVRHDGNRQIRFSTNLFQRAVIDNGNALTGGSFGFGNNLPAGFTPLSRLHSDITTATPNDLRFTNASTTVAGGFTIGIDGAGQALLRQRENMRMLFYTNNLVRMEILNTGLVTVNTATPLVLGLAGNAHMTINSGNADGVFGTTSNGLNPRIYFESRNSGAGNDHAMGHSVPGGVFPFIVSQATSAILWNNIDFINFRSDFNINTRTAAYGGFNATTIEQGFGRLGINNPAAANRVEITSNTGDPYFSSINGSSGLRLTNMTTANIPVALLPGQGMLSVDANGDVIYVNGATNLGGLCANADNPITNNYKIPLNNFNFHFNDNSSAALFNNVGIGTNCNPLTSRLEIINPVMDFGITSTTTSAVPLNFGVRGIASNATAISTGVHGEAIIAGPNVNAGVFGHGSMATFTSIGGDFLSDLAGSANNIAVRARASGNGATGVQAVFGTAQAAGPTAIAIGGDFTAFGSQLQNAGVVGNVNFVTPGSNYGGAFRAVNGTNNYAVYAQVVAPTGVGAGTPPGPNYAGYFLGDVFISGIYGPSDVNMKDNINSITNADSIINLLDPIYFDFKQTGQWQYLSLPQNKQSGLRAQDVELIVPSFVKENVFPTQYDTTGAVLQASFTFKTIDYDKFIPLLLSSNKNLNATVDELEDSNDSLLTIIEALDDRLTTLENCINALNLCDSPSMIAPNNSNNNNATNTVNVDLKDAQTIVLDQNVPNPFAEMTTITYTLNDGVVKAQMLFYNAQGKLINSQDLQTTSGKGQLNVFANDLSNGVYTYTLIVDGKIVDTKRMVKK